MPSYKVTYYNAQGQLVSKKNVHAVNKESLRDQFRQNHVVFGLDIELEENAKQRNKKRVSVKTELLLSNLDVIEVLLLTGGTLQMSLRKIVDGLPDGDIKYLWTEVTSHLEANDGALAPAFAQFPRVFPPAVVGIIAANSKNNKEGIREARAYVDQMNDLKKTAQTAFIYPSIVMIMGFGVFIMMMVFTLPRFKTLLIDLGTKWETMPLLTRVFFGTSDLLVLHPVWSVSSFAGLIALIVGGIKSKKMRSFFERIFLKTPKIGEMIWSLAMARFCTTFASSYKASGQTLASIDNGAMVVGNFVIEQYITDISKKLRAGEARLGEAIRANGKFPVALTIAVENGEADLAFVMNQMGVFYTKQSHRAVNSAVKLLEPALIIVVLGFAAGAMLAMFLPLVSILQNLSK
jgi:type II secretory pathway component PulF